MEHHLARDLLEGYVEESLEPETRSQLERHLATCEECRGILEAAEASVALPNGGEAENDWDEKRMRKTVRRTLFRLVFDALSIWIIGFIILSIVSTLAIQPVLINRGDRARAAAIATWDLAILTSPGATIDSWQNDATLFGREMSLDVVRYVGDGLEPLGAYKTDLGVWSLKNAGGGGIQPFLGSESRPFHPDRIPEDTVATVELFWWDKPLSMAQATALQPAADQARLLWVGFSVADAFPENAQQVPGDPNYVLGYNPCADPTFAGYETAYFSSGSSGGGGSSPCFHLGEATVERSLNELKRATTNLATHPFLVDALDNSSWISLRNVKSVASWLAANEPPVVSLVMTGPSDEIKRLVELSGADGASLLGIDFWNWEA